MPAAEPAGAGPRARGAARRSRGLSTQSTGTEDRPTAGHAEPRRSRGKSRHLLENNRKGPLFYADRINTPYTIGRPKATPSFATPTMLLTSVWRSIDAMLFTCTGW